MTSRYSRIPFAVFVFGVLMFGRSMPTEAAPITITDVRVVIGPASYTAASVGWTFPYTLDAGQNLVLAQSFNDPANQSTSYNFDTSDVTGTQNVAQIFVTTSDSVTTMFTDTTQVLNVRGLDSISLIDNEAQQYTLLNGPAIGYQVFVGYADNVHTGACGTWAQSIGLNGATTSTATPCFPFPFFSTQGVTYADHAGGILPAAVVPSQGLPFHCLAGSATCYESGVIRIVATAEVNPTTFGAPVPASFEAPEPATLTLLMTGGAMLAGRRYARRKRTRT